MNTEERFWAKVGLAVPGECWKWRGSLGTTGYGHFSYRGGRYILAHRYAYELLVGPIPEGLHIDHLCRDRACVNPTHLEPVTVGENTRRGTASEVNRVRMLSKTHCKHGHFYDLTTMRFNSKGHRECLVCERERNGLRDQSGRS